MMTITQRSKETFVIVALDFSTLSEVKTIVHGLPEINFYKVGMELFYAYGADSIDFLKSLNKKIFLDLKINDIPNTIEKAVRSLMRWEPDYLTVFTDKKGVEAAIIGSGTKKTKILNVTLLTSDIDSDFSKSEQTVLDRAEITFQAGGHGVICSGKESSLVRKKYKDFLIVNPGIRLIEEASKIIHDDQKRVVTPSAAWQNGANNIVIGRPVTKANSPKDIIARIYKEIDLLD